MPKQPFSATGLLQKIRQIGSDQSLDEYEHRKLGIFNLLNFLGMLTGLLIPVTGIFNNDKLPLLAWVVACSPFFISALVLLMNNRKQFETSRMLYFILYPIATSLVYASGNDLGIELFFILYGVLAVYLLKSKLNAVLTFALSAGCFLVVHVFTQDYSLKLQFVNFSFFVFVQVLAIIFIFLALILTKEENSAYRKSILRQNEALRSSNEEISKQQSQLSEKALLLEKQAAELTELNAVKTKLFSIIAHDLRNPLYAQKTLFTNIQKYNIDGEQIKEYIPDIINDLNYTTGLVENLLQWAKSQLQNTSVTPQVLDVTQIINEVLQLMKLQAENKKIYLKSRITDTVYCRADKDMINLVLRNLVSNAIKFTPALGNIYIDARQEDGHIEVFVTDDGMGIKPEILPQLFADKFISTHGTSKEAGSGLGLMLCKDFLHRNGGQIFVKSQPGKGTTFSFTLPSPN